MLTGRFITAIVALGQAVALQLSVHTAAIGAGETLRSAGLAAYRGWSRQGSTVNKERETSTRRSASSPFTTMVF